ncbi:DNA-directed RNA polymerase III subunit RPC25 ASCRUDRAFT_77069, partial [Ascoidea rubescens DSM 1968]
MFILSVISDLVKIRPDEFGIPRKKAIVRNLNKKYSNKIIPNLGLAISVWDLITVDVGLLKPGDGSIYINVKFRIVLFKPFIGEVLEGWIEESIEDGLKIKTLFFNEIFIPKDLIFENSRFDPIEKCWIWRPDLDDDTLLYLDLNERIRFRIHQEIFNNIKPTGPNDDEDDEDEEEVLPNPNNSNNQNVDINQNSQAENQKPKKEPKPPAYALIASCQT